MNCNLNVFWWLCQKLLRLQARSCSKLHSYLKTTQWYTANHFRTVPLGIVFWILLYVKTLWITGLKFWVICDIKFDLVESWPARTYLRTRATSLSFPPLTSWINSLNCFSLSELLPQIFILLPSDGFFLWMRFSNICRWGEMKKSFSLGSRLIMNTIWNFPSQLPSIPHFPLRAIFFDLS